MNPPDRLKGVSIVCLVIAALAVAHDVLGGYPKSEYYTLFAVVMTVLSVALERTRAEIRDIREQLAKRESEMDDDQIAVQKKPK